MRIRQRGFRKFASTIWSGKIRPRVAALQTSMKMKEAMIRYALRRVMRQLPRTDVR